MGIILLETINYIEHYGLVRKKDSRGIYEPITEMHSWNSCSSVLLFRIQRHSDHHMHAYIGKTYACMSVGHACKITT